MSFALLVLTLVHVTLSLLGIVAGVAVVAGMLTGRRPDAWTAVFLSTTVATSVTGFLFPFREFLPSHAFGIVSLVVLPVAIHARYSRQLAGRWRATYVLTALLALYLNVFVLVVQAFLKVPVLTALAPTQSEPSFAVTQAVVLVLTFGAGVLALRRFRPRPPPMAAATPAQPVRA